jgi:hypothetical protein
MKLTRFAQFLIPLLVSGQALAGLPPTSLKGQLQSSPKTTFNFQAPLNQATQVSGTTSVIETGSDNALVNPRFSGGTTGWTISGGSSSAASSTLTWDSSAAGQTVTSTGVVVTAGDEGKNQAYSASCRFKTASGTATHEIQLTDGTNILARTPITSSTDFTRSTATGTAPSSGSVYLRVISIASNEPSIDAKNCYLGRAEGFNWAQVSQATAYGTLKYAATTNCGPGGWDTTSTSFGNYSADTDCPTPTVTLNASAPATKVPGLTFSSLPPGEYMVVAQSWFRDVTSDANGCYFRLSDGTNTSGQIEAFVSSGLGFANQLVGHFSYSTAQSSLTFQIQAKSDNAANTCRIGADSADLTFQVYRFPTSTDGSLRADQSAASYSGTLVGAGGGWANTSSGSFGAFSVATTSTTLTQLTSRNLTCVAESTKLPAITCALPKGGTYRVSASGTASNGSIGDWGVRVADGSGNTLSGGFIGHSATAGLVTSFSQQGLYLASSSGSATFQLQGTNFGSGTVSLAEAALEPITWTVEQADGVLPQPLIPGSVFSSSTGTRYTETAAVTTSCTATPCTLATNTPGVTSITRAGAGDYTINFATGSFSAAPTCKVTMGSAALTVPLVSSTRTSTAYQFFSRNTSNAGTDNSFDIECSGPH